jgi:hypothetical protein
MEIMRTISKRLVFLVGYAVVAALALQLTTVTAIAQSQPAKHIYIVQSYEKGHVCGEPQAEGILDALAEVGRNLTAQTYYMDTCRTNATPEAMKSEGQKAPSSSISSAPATSESIFLRACWRWQAPLTYKDNPIPLQGRPLLYDPQVKSF